MNEQKIEVTEQIEPVIAPAIVPAIDPIVTPIIKVSKKTATRAVKGESRVFWDNAQKVARKYEKYRSTLPPLTIECLRVCKGHLRSGKITVPQLCKGLNIPIPSKYSDPSEQLYKYINAMYNCNASRIVNGTLRYGDVNSFPLFVKTLGTRLTSLGWELNPFANWDLSGYVKTAKVKGKSAVKKTVKSNKTKEVKIKTKRVKLAENAKSFLDKKIAEAIEHESELQ
jgi:hypothetical protein